jgi:catechol 2,3-dioxygenase-like lactoylglutathione lyase family enzyme
MEVLGIHHVNVNIHSLPEALAFYVDGLGFTSFDRPGFTIDGAWLNMGPHELHLFVRPDAVIDRNQHFALAVTDINDCARHLDSKGLKYRLAPEMPGVNRQIFIYDPSGNRIELNEVKTLN